MFIEIEANIRRDIRRYISQAVYLFSKKDISTNRKTTPLCLVFKRPRRVFFLRNQPNAHRIPIVFTLIGPDTGDDDHNQAEYHQGKDKKKPNDDKTQKNRDQRVDHQGDLKIEGLLGLINDKLRLVFLHLPDNDGGDEIAQRDKYGRKNAIVDVSGRTVHK